jgi:hypothetical protein
MKCEIIPATLKNCYTTLIIAFVIIYLAYSLKDIQIKRTTIFIITSILMFYLLTYDPTFLCNVFQKNCLRNVAILRSFTCTMSLITIYLVWNQFFNHHIICLVLTACLYFYFIYIGYCRYNKYHNRNEVKKILSDKKNLLRCQFYRLLLICILFFFDVYLIFTYEKPSHKTLYQIMAIITVLVICPIMNFTALYGAIKYDITEIQIT